MKNESLDAGASVQAAENQVMGQIFPDLQEHLNYLNAVYNLAFSVQRGLDGRKIADIPDLVRAQFMILMRITDFARCIQLLCFKGYPEQAGTLAASVFELAHTALFFEHSPDKATQWLSARSIDDQMPGGVLGTNWREVVRMSVERQSDGSATEREYQVYIQLCWMKHSLPKMQDMRVESDGRVRLIFGPYSDERSISHAWFSIEHVGRLTEMVIGLLLQKTGDASLSEAQNALTRARDSLRQKAVSRFGQDNPFF